MVVRGRHEGDGRSRQSKFKAHSGKKKSSLIACIAEVLSRAFLIVAEVHSVLEEI
jgi:hypothetical protein